MRIRQWCVPAATVALVAGSAALATGAQAATAPSAAHPATAAHRPANLRPGLPLRPTVGARPTVRGLITHDTSDNWAGYAATGGTYNSVSASWVQPTGSCTSQDTYSSFWVGLDGDGSNSVEQTGTEVDCSGGSPQYYSWYEMYPAAPVNFSNTIKPGDHITASVTASGSTFTLKLSDTTQNWSKTVTKTSSSASKSSAEVIAEAPYSNGVLPLTNFGTANFTGSTVNGSSLSGTNPHQINLVSDSGVTEATTSSLSGGNFSVTWHSTGS